MSADDTVVKAREDLEQITLFTSSKTFSPQLRDEIKAHFKAMQSGSTLDQDVLLAGLSHGLRVELARFISRSLFLLALFRLFSVICAVYVADSVTN